ncbi:hypothetical protein [Salinisphaera hydrothermalis]|uniref:hypothetical protein n=1 Tax=Salinisphaera hydrothermalis TaxID=563188 RepID=UPI0033402B1F
MQTPSRDQPDEPQRSAVEHGVGTSRAQGVAIRRLAQQVRGSDLAPEVIHNLYCALEHMLVVHSQGTVDEQERELACCYARLQLMMADRAFPALPELADARRGLTDHTGRLERSDGHAAAATFK